MGDPSYVPFRKTYLPSGSINLSVRLKGAFLLISVVTPFVLALLLVECIASVKYGLVSFGTWLVWKCVSCRKTKWGLPFLSSLKSVDLFSGVFSPLILCDMIVGRRPKDE